MKEVGGDQITMKLKPNHFQGMRGTKKIERSNKRGYTIRNNRDRFFYPDEWMAFYDNLKEKQKLTFNLLLNTGARINEAKNIKISDIDFDRCNIILRVTKSVINGKAKKGKQGTSKPRIISVSSKFIKSLRSFLKGKDYDINDYLPILSTSAGNLAMKKALQKTGIQDWDMFSLHNIRKTLETWLLALNVDSFKIIKHFGHTSAIALKHYVSPDIFSWEDKKMMREIIGDLYEK